MATPCRIRCGIVLATVGLVAMNGCAVKRPLSDYWPRADRWREASRNALRDPGTWVPAAGAVLFGATNLDHEVAEWAMTEHPLFDTAKNAEQASDNLRDATAIGMYATALAAPGGPGHWESRWERLLAEQVTVSAVDAITRQTKDAVGRTRPDGTSDVSFPSGHASAAFTQAAFGRRNLRELRLSSAARRGFQIGFTVSAAGTAWARIEAGQHYPADVLASAALGNFMASLIHGAFLKRDGPPPVAIHLERGAAVLRLTLPLGRGSKSNRYSVSDFYEVLDDSSGARLIFVARPLEEAARVEFGPPLAGRNFAIERAVEEAPDVVLAGLLDPGPLPLGPFVYLASGTHDVLAVICRCMPPRVDNIVESPTYRLVPLRDTAPPAGSAPWPSGPGLERVLRLPSAL